MFFDHSIRDLAGSTIGIIGDGTVGREVGRVAEALGMRVVVAGRKGVEAPKCGRLSLDEVLRISDIITLHCPLTPDTRNMLSLREFDLMQRRPLLINTARGGVVDEAAFCKAFEDGKIAGAGFDVVCDESIRSDHPFIRLLSHPNFILTPHIAWASDEAMQQLADQLADNIDAYYHGVPRHLATRHPAGRNIT